MTAVEMIKAMPKTFKPELAGDLEATVQYNISEPMYHIIKNKEVTVHEGKAENPTLSISLKDEDFVKLFYGKLNPMTAFMTGKLKIKGDVMLAQRLVSLFTP